MGCRPKSRREALLIELCSHGGYCSNGLTVDDLVGDLTADEITEMVLRGEGLDPVMGSGEARDEVGCMVKDWLFDARGRGAKSGLPQ